MEDLDRRVTDAQAKPCRLCGSDLEHTFCNLGMSPLANSYLTAKQLDRGEVFYPLLVLICGTCMLVQLAQYEAPGAIFDEYLYFSSYSQTWLNHARDYVNDLVGRFRLDSSHRVVEIASNDGYLLQYVAALGIPALGIEPAANVAAVAKERGIDTRVAYFGSETARTLVDEGVRADVLIGNNVLAHVPDLNDFVAGMPIVLAPRGVITLEFPHLLQLIDKNQFDTIYHEHFSYFSLHTVTAALARHGLRVFDVEQVPTHGGSLRVFACHADNPDLSRHRRVDDLAAVEREAGLDRLEGHAEFPERVQRTKRELLKFLIDARERGLRTVAYGAPAKGNTLLNYCGIREDLIEYTVDVSPHKQGHFLPGTHLPIYAVDVLKDTRPDYVLILPWNLTDEIVQQISYIREWGGKFVIPIPEVQIID